MTNGPKSRTQRVRSPHPGVRLKAPSGARAAWRARYVDPDSNKEVFERIPPEEARTAGARRLWAMAKAKELAQRRSALDAGAPRATGAPLVEVIQRYYDAHPQLKPKTLSAYRAGTDQLLAWARLHGVTSADDLNRARLLEFKAHLIRLPKRAPARKGKRGERKATAQRRGPVTVNRELRAVRTALGYLVDLDQFARLSHDDLRRALKRIPAPTELPVFLNQVQCGELITATLAHDADCWAETRAEHAGERERGTTAKYTPIAPFALFTLLSGMRAGEALGLEWSAVNLDARDHAGNVAGEITLAGATVKTGKARVVTLEVSPALRALLLALRPERARGRVFAELAEADAQNSAKRLRRDYGAPAAFTWQVCRSTAGTFLTNAPGVFGAASAYRSAKQLGHSVQVAEKHYVGLVRGISPEARSLEAAMEIAEHAKRVIAGTPGWMRVVLEALCMCAA